MTKAGVSTDCIGCALCPDVCPEVFEMEDDGFAHVVVDEVEDELIDSTLDAAEQCPVGAISVEEE